MIVRNGDCDQSPIVRNHEMCAITKCARRQKLHTHAFAKFKNLRNEKRCEKSVAIEKK